MTTLRTAAQQALEALEDHATQYPHMQKGYTVDAIAALRAALAETHQDWDEIEALRESLREHMAEIHRLRAELAENALQRLTDVHQEIEATGRQSQSDEPVAWMDIDSEGNRLSVRQWSNSNDQEVPLYTAPQRNRL